MKIKMNETMHGIGGEGEEVDVPAKLGKALVDSGRADRITTVPKSDNAKPSDEPRDEMVEASDPKKEG